MYWWLFYFFGWIQLWNVFSSPVHCGFFFLSALSSEPPDIVLLTTGISVHPCSFVFPQFVSIRSVLNIYHLPLAHPPLISVSLSPSPWSSSSFSPSLCSTPPSDLLCLCVASHGQWCGKGLHYSQSRHPASGSENSLPGQCYCLIHSHPPSPAIIKHSVCIGWPWAHWYYLSFQLQAITANIAYPGTRPSSKSRQNVFCILIWHSWIQCMSVF